MLLHQRLDALHVHTCMLVGMSSHVHTFSRAFVVTAVILLHALLRDLVCAFSHIYGMCVCMQNCLCVCARVCTDLPKDSQGWVAWGMLRASPSVTATPVPPVPGHAVSVVHPNALPHPPKPQAAPAREEGEQGGLHEEHAVSPTSWAPSSHSRSRWSSGMTILHEPQRSVSTDGRSSHTGSCCGFWASWSHGSPWDMSLSWGGPGVAVGSVSAGARA